MTIRLESIYWFQLRWSKSVHLNDVSPFIGLEPYAGGHNIQMQQRLEAIYENGQFRPLQTPNVPEGQTVQIIISTIVPQNRSDLTDPPIDANSPISYQPASGRSLLRHARTWVGDDFEECLQSIYTSRSQTNFYPEIETVE